MRKQDQLSALIGSLSKNEKRYFKLQASLHSGDKTFKRLFDELAKSDTYNPEVLSKKLNTPKPHLGQAKKYLEKVLLGALRNYEQDNSLKIWLNNQWQEVTILCSRKQFELALSINEKALEKAVTYDDFLMTHRLLGLKYNLLVFLGRGKEAEKLNPKITLSVEQLREQQLLTDINKKFADVANGKRYTERLFEKIEQEEIFNTLPGKLKSTTSVILWHEMKQNYYYYIKRNVKTAIHHNLLKLNTFETQPQLIHVYSPSYLSGMVYLTSHYGDIGNYEEALKFARKLEAEADDKRKDIPINFIHYFNILARALQVYLLCYLGRYADAVKKAAEFANKMSELQTSHFIITKHHYSVALFYTKKYDDALKICEELLSAPPEINRELLLSNRVLTIMIHHALKNYSLLPHLAGSAASWTKRHKVSNPGADELIRWFRKFEKVQPETEASFFLEFDNAVRKDVFKDYARELGLKTWVKNNLAYQKA